MFAIEVDSTKETPIILVNRDMTGPAPHGRFCHLTPEEARLTARYLNEAADYAEGHTPVWRVK